MHKVRTVRCFSYHSSHRNAPRKNLSPNRVKLHGIRREPQPIKPVPHISLLYLISEASTPTTNGDVARIELVHLGTANRNPSNVQFNFNFSLDYASIPRTVPPLDQWWMAAPKVKAPAAPSSRPPFHMSPQPKPLEELSNKRKRNPVDNDHPPSHKKTEDVPSR